MKVGKMNYRLGKMDPNWAKCLKSGQNISRSGQKKIIHKIYRGERVRWRTGERMREQKERKKGDGKGKNEGVGGGRGPGEVWVRERVGGR